MKVLADYLAARGLHKKDFAKQIGVTPGRVSQFMNDARQLPSPEVIAKIEEVTEGAVTFKDWIEHRREAAA